jgi:hypothetical protein
MEFEFSEPSSTIATDISDWYDEYITKEHPQLGRNGPVCPFVAPAIRADSLYCLTHEWRGAFEVSRMHGLINAIIERFASLRWPTKNSNLHGLVVVITGLPQHTWWLVDEGHRQAKSAVVERGYMIGQFHPLCDQPAALNPLFAVSRSPYPLFAIRNMAVHDILFLHSDPVWFAHYEQRFGHRFATNAGVGDPYRALFHSHRSRLAENNRISQPVAPGKESLTTSPGMRRP